MVRPQVLEADLRLLDASLLTLGALHLHPGTRQALHTHLCCPCLLGREASGGGGGGLDEHSYPGEPPQEGLPDQQELAAQDRCRKQGAPV